MIAIRNGTLLKASAFVCEICANVAQVYHHPNGYDEINVFNIIPLCRKCHAEITWL